MMSQTQAAAILGVEIDASRAVVQRAFRDIAREVHPDAGAGEAAVKLQQAKEARDLLLAARTNKGRRIVAGPRPWPPTAPSWPPKRGEANHPKPDEHVTPNRFAASPVDAGDDPTASRDFADRLSEASERGSNWIVMLTLVGVLVVFLIVGAILIVGALFGSNPEPNPAPNINGCVAITDSGLTEVDCAAPDAQRIVSRTDAIRSCPTGQNTLIVGQTTWCLEHMVS